MSFHLPDILLFHHHRRYKVIEVVGTTFGEEAWEDIFRLVKKVRNERYLF